MVGMQESVVKKVVRCGIYTRKSHEEGLEQEFNSLDAQRESAESYIDSQRMQGWKILPDRYDDGGFSGSTMERPALQKLLIDIDAGKIDVVVVYKIDRLSRSLLDFTKMVEVFNQKGVCFVSVTQHFSTTDSTGRMMLNILMTFAQYEREVIADRIRDKVAAAKRRGKYCGGIPILGYDVDPENKKLIINEDEAKVVRFVFRRFIQLGSSKKMTCELNEQGYRTKAWITRKGKKREGALWNTSHIYRLLNNRMYIGMVSHNKTCYQGEHKAIIDQETWDKVQAVLSDSKPMKLSIARTKTMSSLKGVVKCGHCGCSMGPTYTKKGDRLYTYYICEKDVKRSTSECPIKRVPAGDIEKAVLGQLSAVFQTPTLVAKTFMAAREIEKTEHERLLKRKEEIALELSAVRQQALVLMKPDGASANKDERLNLLNQKVTELTRQQSQVIDQAKSFDDRCVSEQEVSSAFQNIDSFWADLFPTERNRLVRLLVESVEIYESGIDLELKTNGLTTLVTELAGMASNHEEGCRNE